jgi:NADPH:quinone reductase-like Zn-dependent oxidoreductase
MSNKAAWSIAQGGPVKVGDAPMPHAEPGYVVVKNAATAINPADWKMQDPGWGVKEWPTIFGCDVAGEVYAVGEVVTGFKKGQRVMGNCCRLITGRNEEAGFQLYTSVVAALLAPIPDEMSFEEASVVPLSISTAAAGLYRKDKLAVPLPTADSKLSGGKILIWGGNSSVGCSTIQLAKASGLDIVATASKQNFQLVKSLGATAVFDRRSPTVIDDLINEMKSKKIVGCFDCIGLPETTKACAEAVSQPGGQFIASVGHPENLPSNVKGGMGMCMFADCILSKAVH